MKKVIGIGLMALLALSSCKKNEGADQLKEGQTLMKPQEPFMEGDLVENTKKNAQTNLALSEPDFDFGKIKKGDVVNHVFEVTNTGKNPLIISNVQPTCGCTVPDFTKEPILPGKTGKITLTFNSANFDGIVHKTASVYANVAHVPIELRFTADIQP